MEMNRNTLSNFREDFKVSMTILEEQYGLSITMGTIRYPRDASNFTCKLTAVNVGDLKVGDNVEQAEFKVSASKFGFEPADYNRTTNIYGQPHRLVGFNANARKNVCIVRQISNGTDYVMNARTVLAGF